MVDRGNPEAKVLFIGEAPGKNEDAEGRAFVGRSGRLLDTLMKDVAGFDTDQDGLIINVVKCRPPANRPPLPDEVEACSPYLQKQFELVKPRIVVLLGATAFRRMFPAKKKFSMREEAGKFFKDERFPAANFIIFYHPAFILRDPRKRPLMKRHIRQFRDFWLNS